MKNIFIEPIEALKVLIEFIKPLPPVVICFIMLLMILSGILIFSLRKHISLGRFIGAVKEQNDWGEIFGSEEGLDPGAGLGYLVDWKQLMVFKTDVISIPDEEVFATRISRAIQWQRDHGQGIVINLVAIKRANQAFWNVMTTAMEDVIQKNNIHIMIVCPTIKQSSDNMNAFFDRISNGIKAVDCQSIEMKRDEMLSAHLPMGCPERRKIQQEQ